jgi:glyoxylase-like metal-dependent hydrolase (beta-lactamase superfamily II)
MNMRSRAVKISIFAAGFCTCPEHLAIQGGRRTAIRFPAMFALFEHPDFGPMLFDTGYSYRFFSETRRFPNRLYRLLTPVTLAEEQLAVNQLARRGLRPADITRVFISHFHADHIAALADFPRARYTYLPQAYDAVRHKRGWAAVSHGHLPGLIPADFAQRGEPVPGALLKPLPPEYAPFWHGYDLLGDESLLAVALPGHARGQMGIFARGETGDILFFVADAAWLRASYLQSRLPGALALNLLFDDPPAYRETLAGVHQFHSRRPEVKIIPSHCAQTLAELQAG